MLKVFTDLFSGLATKKSNKERKRTIEERKNSKHRQKVLHRQKELVRSEINLEWRIVFGDKAPKKRRDTFVIKDVTQRNIWMEDSFLFNQIKILKPDEIFHNKEYYALRWQPPGSLFRLIIRLDDLQLQENALLVMSKFSKSNKQNALFFFYPLEPSLDTFAPRVHPSSLVSYRTKNEVLKKLSDFFLQGRLSVDDIQQTLLCDEYVWSASLYNLLPADEQVYHTYLNEMRPLADSYKSLTKSYIDGDISLQEYEDSKFPDRKKIRDIESQIYPLAVQRETCTICHIEGTGIVSCHTCTNMVCAKCMHTVFNSAVAPSSSSIFGEKETLTSLSVVDAASNNFLMKSGPVDDITIDNHSKSRRSHSSFLLMHQRYCMKLGELPEVIPIISDEPAYLREFRNSSRLAALDKLLPKKAAPVPTAVVHEKDVLLLEDEEEEAYLRSVHEAKIRAEEEEKLRMLQLNPIALQALRDVFDNKIKRKFDKFLKEINDLTEKIQDASHTEQFIARNERLRLQQIAKMVRQIEVPVQLLANEVKALRAAVGTTTMVIEGPYMTSLIQDIEELQSKATALHSYQIAK